MTAMTLLGLVYTLAVCMKDVARMAAEPPVCSRLSMMEALNLPMFRPIVNQPSTFSCADCSSGLPTTCDHRCAILVERFHGACQSFLSQPINKAMSTMVEQTYQICLRSGGANGH
eukprot:SAG31_NODE_1489_length_8135_cov_3.382558_5_plen_115_part_00